MLFLILTFLFQIVPPQLSNVSLKITTTKPFSVELPINVQIFPHPLFQLHKLIPELIYISNPPPVMS
jgi:hypothetical protein